MIRLSVTRRSAGIGLLVALLLALGPFAAASVASAAVPSKCVYAKNRDGVKVAEVCVNPDHPTIHVTDIHADGMSAVGFWSTDSRPDSRGYSDRCVDGSGAKDQSSRSSKFCDLYYDLRYAGNPGDQALLTTGDRVCFRAADLAGDAVYYQSERVCLTLTGAEPIRR